MVQEPVFIDILESDSAFRSWLPALVAKLVEKGRWQQEVGLVATLQVAEDTFLCLSSEGCT